MLEYFNRWWGPNLNSDLIKLGILPKPISEYTDADIGSIILIPYTDESGKILLNNGCIEFEVVGVNHHKDINDESKPTITLMTKNIIREAAFDIREPNNTDWNRKMFGNNRWSVSNIRQWLNSEGVANEWFTKQHEFDEAPTTDIGFNEVGIYADDPGFLVGFSDEIKQHFATVRNKTILCNLDKSALSKDFEETDDKVFLPSFTEMGFGNNKGVVEGIHLDKKFRNDDSRIKSGTTYCLYWMRSPNFYSSSETYHVRGSGSEDVDTPNNGYNGIAPLVVLH